MKPKTIITGALLLFVAASVAAILIKERRTPPMPAPEVAGSTKVIAYYFHGNVRCATCRKIEALAVEALRTGFPGELQNGRLEWRAVNVDEPGNEHFVRDYELETRSVVLADIENGTQTRWNNLKKIWDLVRDDPAFIRYVQDEARAYLETH